MFFSTVHHLQSSRRHCLYLSFLQYREHARNWHMSPASRNIHFARSFQARVTSKIRQSAWIKAEEMCWLGRKYLTNMQNHKHDHKYCSLISCSFIENDLWRILRLRPYASRIILCISAWTYHNLSESLKTLFEKTIALLQTWCTNIYCTFSRYSWDQESN